MKKYNLSIYKILSLLFLYSLLSSCTKYLDERPDKSLVVPSTIQDCQALLDDVALINNAAAPSMESSCADYYLTTADWLALTNVLASTTYVWDKNANITTDWYLQYQYILKTNVALETLAKIQPDAFSTADWQAAKGTALFFRAYAFFQLAQEYAKPFDKNTASQDLGIPLRLSADINEVSVRSTVKETYDRIFLDMKEAAALLPINTLYKTRPCKAAAVGSLARFYLAAEDYVQAGLYADSCLQLNNTLIDYNTLNAAAANPLSIYNNEVILHSRTLGLASLNPSICKVDSILYQSYTNNDLRRTIFFNSNGNGSFAFKGNYDGQSSGPLFNGITVDETYLVRAECFARNNNITNAMSDLNTLLLKRWKTGTFVPVTATNADDALSKVLNERRKELIFRSQRWSDLRRLNKDSRFAVTLTRVVNGQTYTLPPGDLRYVLLIPTDVIAITGMPQNPR